MKTLLIIARHGNCFKKGEIPTRLGAGTDLALVEEEKGRRLGKYLKAQGLIPDQIFCGPLKRHHQTTQLAIEEMQTDRKIITEERFTEIDYGPDENKPEEEVIKRIGRDAIELWNSKAQVPKGWKVKPAELIKNWRSFAGEMEEQYLGQKILLVSSNGVIRFAPYLTGDFNEFAKNNRLKVATGALCLFEKEPDQAFWQAVGWDIKP